MLNDLPPLPLLSSPPAALTGPDLSIATALTAWLHALDLVPSPADPLELSLTCVVPLCELFVRFAPTFLSDRDFFIPAASSILANVSRQRRYNVRRLARSLSDWYALAPRSSSPSRSPSRTPTPTPPVSLAPKHVHLVLALADADSTDGLDNPHLLLALAEVTLCAAVHSPTKDAYIKTVLTLPTAQQDALAASIKRTIAAPDDPANHRTTGEAPVLQPVSLNDENRADGRKLPPRSPHRPAAKGDDPLSAPRGIPLAEYKALAAERDGLRKKLAAAEQERTKAAEDVTEATRRLDEAGDRIRELEHATEGKDKELDTKAKALIDAKNALRVAHVSAEEVDVLRVKAASAEQLEASLKRASKRLEEVADMRRANKDLETQLSAFRENEERIGKHTEYLEAQLSSSNERAHQLAVVSEGLSSNLEEKDAELSRLSTENDELQEKLETANKQLASMLVQSSVTQHVDDTATQTAASGDTSARNLEEVSEDKNDASQEQAAIVADSGQEAAQFNEAIVSEHLFSETGVKMTWADIVECIQGVMDALHEMDGTEGSNGSSFRGQLPADEGISVLSRSGDSEGSDHSEEGNNNDSSANDSQDNMKVFPVLPEFSEVDSKLHAANNGIGDEFDFAANHVNVEEISLLRRGSSLLATIPENREGFRSDDGEGSEESSYISGYTTDEASEPVDATVNATVDTNSSPGSMPAEGGPKSSPLQTSCKSASSRPDSPLLGNLRCVSKVENQRSLSPVQIDTTYLQRSSYNSLPSNVRRATSLTVNVLGALRRSPSHSDTTRVLVQQARSELDSLQKAMEAMRAERQASASISVLVQQLNSARNELMVTQAEMGKKESENMELRKEITGLMKELDSVALERKVNEDRETRVLMEKERLVTHLQESLTVKEQELKENKENVSAARKQVQELQDAEAAMSERLRAAEVIGRAQEVEMARLSAKIEANESLTTRLNAVVSKTDGLRTQMSRQHENHIMDLTAAAKREKQLAEEARDEARQMAKTQASVLEDVRATAAAAALARSRGSEERLFPSRKSTRFGGFWRRLLHLEKLNIDYSMPASTTSLPTMRESKSRKSVGISG